LYRRWLREIPLTTAFPLAFFAHFNQQFKDLPDIDRIDLVFNGKVEGILEHGCSSLVIPYGGTITMLEKTKFTSENLPLCDQGDNLSVDPADLLPYGLNGHLTE